MSKTFCLMGVLLASCVCWNASGTTWYVDGMSPVCGDGTSWLFPFWEIQKGIDAASDGDTVIVAEDTYGENIHFHGKSIVLRSKDPQDPTVAGNTIIDRRNLDPVVTFNGTENKSCVFSGFMIMGGGGECGAGICGGTWDNHTYATIEHNVMTTNEGKDGGGVANADGVIRYNTITKTDTDEGHGGALYGCDGLIQNNAITDNKADEGDAGGLYGCDGTIEGNTISGNYAEGNGGGLVLCNGTIRNNIISGNTACWSGGGLCNCSGIIQNNTIFGNLALWNGAGLYDCHGTVRNNIIWGNSAPSDSQLDHSETVSPGYCCIQDWPHGGAGNIVMDPQFLNAEHGTFRLRPGSPCIDAGFNDPELSEFDIVGIHRIMFGGKSWMADMGAYEFYINRLRPVPGTSEAVFTWSSLADKTYSIFYTDDILNWHTAVADFPSSGNETTFWLDDASLTGISPFLAPKRFYRILENP